MVGIRRYAVVCSEAHERYTHKLTRKRRMKIRPVARWIAGSAALLLRRVGSQCVGPRRRG
jgi:hypothetical protein